MKFYEYVHRDSFIHRLDPRAKMFWLVIFSALVFMTSSPAIVTGILAFTLLIGIAAKLPKEQLWHSTKIFIIFLPVAYVLLYIFLLGPNIGAIVGGLVFTAKFLVLIFAAVIFTMTTSSRDMLLALTKMKVPYAFAFMLTIAIRFIPVITKEINSVIDAQRARAYEISFSLKHPVRSVEKFVPILIPVLMLLLKRSHELSLSIDSRAFRAKKKVTYSRRLRFKAGDWLFSILVFVILLAVIFI
ncbi:energy-coupling factor transporter transmembrane protein EcfT [archaeon]|nr:MAG: energy-coupling factor transporter transmembrane protein EcfT [archaeon]